MFIGLSKFVLHSGGALAGGNGANEPAISQQTAPYPVIMLAMLREITGPCLRAGIIKYCKCVQITCKLSDFSH